MFAFVFALKVTFTAMNVAGVRTVQLLYGETVAAELGMVAATGSSLNVAALPALQTSFAYRVRVSGAG